MLYAIADENQQVPLQPKICKIFRILKKIWHALLNNKKLNVTKNIQHIKCFLLLLLLCNCIFFHCML